MGAGGGGQDLTFWAKSVPHSPCSTNNPFDFVLLHFALGSCSHCQGIRKSPCSAERTPSEGSSPVWGQKCPPPPGAWGPPRLWEPRACHHRPPHSAATLTPGFPVRHLETYACYLLLCPGEDPRQVRRSPPKDLELLRRCRLNSPFLMTAEAKWFTRQDRLERRGLAPLWPRALLSQTPSPHLPS